jgi:two-component system sensor histidine kinase RpfC
MPRLNGIEACKMWRQIEGGRSHFPIIGVTADATAETEQRCLDAGMDMRITKPVDAKLLLRSIAQLCGSAELPSKLSSPDPLNVVVPIIANSGSEVCAIDPAQFDYLRSIGDEQFLNEMIQGFFEDVGNSIKTMCQSVDDCDVQQFRFSAHAFKSAANNIGATTLGMICAKLEHITEGEFQTHRQSELRRVETELARVESALRDQNTSSPVNAAAVN